MAEFYSARGWEIPPLPWTNLSPPFSLANHYDTAVVPARPYKPRDKAKVEVAVQITER